MKLIGGFYFPDSDQHCHKVTMNQVKDVEKALERLKDKNVCIQAGGNVGVWAKYLSNHFKTVYSFEPDPENFECFNENVKEKNVYRLQAGLGVSRGTVGLDREYDKNNCGAYIADKMGPIPVFRIDDLNLDQCDFIQLDIEGMELEALKGAVFTIDKFRPLIMYEDKDLAEKFGSYKGHIEEYMKRFGYEVAGRIHRDVIIEYRPS